MPRSMIRHSEESRNIEFSVAINRVSCENEGDIPDEKGITAVEIMRRKRDPDFHKIAVQLR